MFVKVIARECKAYAYTWMRPVVWWQRRAFPTEDLGLNMVNKNCNVGGYLKNDLDVSQTADNVANFIQMDKSKGSYVVDADGNHMLDVCGTELNPLGYNHHSFRAAINNRAFDASIINNGVAGDAVASEGFRHLVTKSLSISPPGMRGVALSNHSNAVGDAIRQAFLVRAQDGPVSNHVALTFKGSLHESPLTHGGIICRWPQVAYPKSSGEEAQVLEAVRSAVQDSSIAGSPVSAIVIEPTQYHTGYTVSESFINQLKTIAGETEAALIVDESGTGFGATGEGLWQYNNSSDYLVFGKRSIVSGYFSKE